MCIGGRSEGSIQGLGFVIDKGSGLIFQACGFIH